MFTNATGALPVIRLGLPDQGCALQISGMQTAKVDASLGVNLLGSIIGALGGNLGIKAQCAHAAHLAFTYLDVAEESVDVAPPDGFLGGATVRDNLHTVSQLLDADDVFLFTRVLKTRRFGVEAFDSHDRSLDLDVPIIQQVAGGQLRVAADPAWQSQTLYQGSTSLAFVFKAVQLIYDQGA